MKWLTYEDAARRIDEARRGGKRVVQCHGTFDLIHPGHVLHLEEAKSLGDLLVTTVTTETQVNKGPGRPYFNDLLRVKMLAALECVDFVVVIPYAAAVEAIELVRPDIYCKGVEYAEADNDPTGNIADDVTTVERLGGEVRYVGSEVFSSTALLNRHFENTHASEAAKEFCREIAFEWSPSEIRRAIESFADLNVLVVGDLIFDRYSAVEVLGLTSKNRTLSARHLGIDLQGGGSLAVFRHVRQFTRNVRLAGLVGDEDWVSRELADHLGAEGDAVVRDPSFTTVVKHRYVEMKEEGGELAKLFSINHLDDEEPSDDAQSALYARVREELIGADIVLVMDFGHGVMQPKLRRLVEDEARMMSLNCQTNSYNHGFNLINKQYRRADCFSLDQTELSLAMAERHIDFESSLAELKQQLGSRYAWLTRGDVETIGLRGENDKSVCPPLETNVTDTVGAGDAFCSLAALSAAKDLPIGLATYFGQIAGALAVRTVGNRAPVERGAFIKAATTLASF